MGELLPTSNNGYRLQQMIKLDTFIKMAQEKHGDKYDYSKVVMNGMSRHIIIGCKVHGDFNQAPSNHLHTSGCNKCGIVARTGITKTIVRKDQKAAPRKLEDFIAKAIEVHGDKYDYSKTVFNGIKEECIIICKIHGEFSQILNNHLNNHGCRECGKIKAIQCLKQKMTTEEFILRSKKKHGDLYDYSNTKYISSECKVKIRCKTHGEFEADPPKHYRLGYGCPICTGCGVSFAQLEWLHHIENTTGEDIVYKGGKHNKEESFRFNNKLYRVDGFCEETNTIYEFLGCWYHGCLKCRDETVVHPWSKKTMKQLYQESLDRKTILEENGYTVVYMWECEWKVRSNTAFSISDTSGENLPPVGELRR
jgi:hypothetical protein